MKLKKIFVILLIVIMNCIVNFAAVVSDNDGSAYVTLPEFDAVLSEFENKLNEYYNFIDVKIAKGIKDYLEGIIVEGNHVKTKGYIPDIARYDEKFTKFGYGNALNTTTSNPMEINLVNNFICIMYIPNVGVSDNGWEMIQYLGHKPPEYSGQWESPNNGCNLVGFEKATLNNIDYLGLDDNANVNKWQFKLSETFSGIKSGNSKLTNNTDRNNANNWDFTKDKDGKDILKPSAIKVTENIAGMSLECTKTISNTIVSSTTNPRCNYGNYYYTSGSALLYGWLEEEYYVYDNETVKEEKPVTYSQRRIRRDNADKFINYDGYIFKYYQPKTYTVKFDNLVNIGATKVLGEPVYCYNGLPIYTFPAHTKNIKISLSINSCGSNNISQYKLYIAKKPFDNISVTNTSLLPDDIVYKDNNFVSVGDRIIELDLDIKEKTTLYLKLVPSTQGENYALNVSISNGGGIEYDYK